MNENVTDLVIQIQNGENAAFEKIFEIYKVSAIRTAYLLTNNKALAEDITQEAFVQCYLKINTLKNPAQFKTWFFKILTRIAWKINTKEKEAVPVENIFEIYNSTDNSSVEDNFINKETSEKIMAAINQLEQKQKTVVLLYYYKEFSISEIANIMSCFEGTVKSRLYCARKNLKKKLNLETEDYIKEVIGDEIIYKSR